MEKVLIVVPKVDFFRTFGTTIGIFIEKLFSASAASITLLPVIPQLLAGSVPRKSWRVSIISRFNTLALTSFALLYVPFSASKNKEGSMA